MFEKPLPPARRDRLMKHPDMKEKLRVLNLICIAFFMAPWVYLGLLLSGIFPTSGIGDSSFPLWLILVGISIVQIPPMFVVGTLLLNQMKKADTFSQAFTLGQTTLVVVLAFAEAVSIYGLVSPFLGGPSWVGVGLIGFGVVLMTVGLLVFRPKVLNMALTKFSEEIDQEEE